MKQPLFVVAALFALSLAPACDSGDKEAADTAAAPAADGADATAKADIPAADPAIQKEVEEMLSDDTSGLDPKVAKAVSIAKEIESDPSKAEDVLAKHELDREGLDALMYEIARSPELAKSYASARMNS